MLNTRIYKQRSPQRFLIGFIGVIGLCFLLFNPVKGTSSETQNTKEEASKVVFTVQTDSNKIEPGSMSAEEFYLIRTQSNEYLIFVDARSEEEYKASHIESSISLKKFESDNPMGLGKIRVFFYSNNDTRSREMASFYAEKGLRAYYIVGGMKAWEPIQGILPIISDV